MDENKTLETTESGIDNETENGTSTDAIQNSTGENEPSIESLISDLATERAEKERFKTSIDKLTHRNAELQKQLRERMTAQEQEDEAKREREEARDAELDELRKFRQRTLAEKRYQLQGMTVEMSEMAAEAEVSGDMDKLSKIQKQHLEAVVKKEKAEWLGTRPNINAGGGAYSSMTKDEILAIKDTAERQKAIAQNIGLFTGGN